MANDPKNKITDYMTNPEVAPDEKSRLMSGPQKEWYLEQDTEFRVLGWGSSKSLKETDQKNMAAYQGRRSDDLVEMMKADKDLSAIQAGTRPEAEKYLKGRQDG